MTASQALGCFPVSKFPGNFGPNGNGTVRTRWKFVLSKWSTSRGGPLLTGRFSPILRFRFQKFSFPVPLQLVTTVKMADGSDVSVYECSVCKLQTQDLMHSCTQGSGTVAVHLNLFFFWFSSVFKDKYITAWLLRILTMFSCVFLLAACDPSPYGFWQSERKNTQLIPTTSTSSTQALGKMGGQTRPFTHCKLNEVQRRIWEVTYYPTINSVGLLVRTRSIFPWLVRVVSDRSVRPV